MTPVSESPVLRCHPADSVAVALADIAVGATVSLDDQEIVVREAVAAGHKLALRHHARGEAVIKYGEAIGRATADIDPGTHVHSHNLATALEGEVEYRERLSEPDGRSSAPLGQWRGYRRPDGRWATRNEIWVLPTVGCVAPLAEDVAREAAARHRGVVDGVHGFAHPHGCSQLGDDLAGTRRLLAGLCDNPNAGGVLLIGLGCESNQLDALLAEVPERSRGKIRTLRAQEMPDERQAALDLIDELVAGCAGAHRETAEAAELVVGLKCGGSDALSGVTANPLLGRFSDRLAASGGSVVLTEIPEIFGAENALLARSVSADVHRDAGDLLNRFKRYFLEQGQPVSENPSPGNIAGGITTLEEKSLGAVQKAGKSALAGVLDYGEQASIPGLSLLEAPGNDAVSSTALAAAGATMIVFTTGRGTPLGFPVPTVKVASNTILATLKSHWIDFDAGRLLSEPEPGVVEDFCRTMLGIAGGVATASERGGHRVIAIWKRGVTL
uniref:UxaA family hydrolase n=1 Tax=Altererythrobacter segetis TaxID=1104773 RepID=UPI0014074883|nr:altronate dehydratase family protein [Altererythrobacter segetis]